MVTRIYKGTGETFLTLGRNEEKKVRYITRNTGKIAEGEKAAEWCVVVMRQRNG